ncbi:MAG: nucleotide pyrophosphatase [Rhodospirillales bacterium]|nr:nucleotide pyrophosphatase [Rhodospirillales bacterium]
MPNKENRKILIVMMDGFDPAYLQASDMPNTKQMVANGFFKTVKGIMPSVTNVNNTGICCGGPPSKHGITANSYFDLQTRKEEYMDKAAMVLAPTVFERAAPHGFKSALMTAKKKTQSLLRTGANIRLAAEAPKDAEGSNIDWVARLGPAPDIYSLEINLWLFRAAQIALNEAGADLVYFHTTDYIMHMEPPWGDKSQFHLNQWDKLLGETLHAHPNLEVYMSADHGMNFKSRCYDLNTVVPNKGGEIFFAMSAERDPYVKHHRTFGGTAFVWLKHPGDFDRVADICRRLDGVEAVYDRYTAASKFLLHPDRIGDMLVTGDIDTVFGPLADNKTGIEEMPEGFRTHGGSDEAIAPLIIYNREVDPRKWREYNYNFDLTKGIGF